MPGPSILRLTVESRRPMSHHPTRDTAGPSQSAPVTSRPPNRVQSTTPTTDSEPTPPAARCSVFRSGMASPVTVKRLKKKLKRRGLPTYGDKSILLERCRENGVTCSSPDDPNRSPRSLGPPPDSIGVTRTDVLPVAVAPADTSDTASASGTPPVVEAGGAPPAASAAAAAPSPAVGPTAAAVAGSRGQASPFSKHEKARLAHVLCTGEVAAGVGVSRGPMSRHQQDARSSRSEFWVVVVAEMFNGTDRFFPPQERVDGGLDPNVHPYGRPGLFLKAKWSEVSGASLHFICMGFLCSAQ